MFCYGQKTDNKQEPWTLFPAEQRGEMLKVLHHVSVYQQSEPHREDLDYDEVAYKGDLVMDIDYATIEEATIAVNAMLDLLESKYGVCLDCLSLACSGTKGYHVTIPHKLMATTAKPVKRLPKYHGWVARMLASQAGIQIDNGPYARKHLIRVTGAPNKHAFKVPISVEEARAMTPALYAEMTKHPRTLPVTRLVPDNQPSGPLVSLFATAKEHVRNLDSRTKETSLPVEMLQAFNDSTAPLCMQWHLEGVNLSTGTNFNKMAMNVASYLNSAPLSSVAKDKFIDEFARKSSSQKYSSEAARKQHVAELLVYASNGHLAFSCGYTRKSLSASPCSGCVVREKLHQQAVAELGVEAREEGYFAVTENAARRLSNFTLVRNLDYVEFRDASRNVVLSDMEIHSTSGIESRQLTPAVWHSLAAFRKEITGVAEAVWLTTSDADLHRVRLYLQQMHKPETIMRVNVAGISLDTTLGVDLSMDWTSADTPPALGAPRTGALWAEQGWSLNEHCISGNYHCTATTANVAKMAGRPPAGVDDEQAHEVLLRLMSSNHDYAVAQMLGWVGACWIREYLWHLGFREFPLLHIFGEPTSGKTKSATVYACLAAADYTVTGPASADTISRHPLRLLLSSTLTVPRILDEVNKKKMNHRRFSETHEFLKTAYNRNQMNLGTVSKNSAGEGKVSEIEFVASSPVIYLSGERMNSGELEARSLYVAINKRDHAIGNFRKNFQFVEREGVPSLFRIAKMLLLYTVRMPVHRLTADWKATEAKLPDTIQDRERANLVCTLLGLQHIKEACEANYWPQAVADRLDELSCNLLHWWQHERKINLPRDSAWSPHDHIMATLAVMAELPIEHHHRLTTPLAYVWQGDLIYLNMPIAWSYYCAYVRAIGDTPMMSTSDQFIEAVSYANYYRGTQRPLGFIGPMRHCMSASSLEDSHIPAHAFST